ncbi:hypothetical protein, partial [Collinsella aerofaciens]|uniref:hypothetical protein n=1 Tax=Collinsella aerofaciens TaxID=74426 RepID=UPI00195C15EE
MSTATCLVAAILITSGTIQRSTRPQTTLFLLICSIKVALNGNKSHQELQFIANKCNHNGNSTHICPFLTTTGVRTESWTAGRSGLEVRMYSREKVELFLLATEDGM